MADKIAALEVGEFTGADPFALIVGGEPIAAGGDGEAGGRAQAGRDGRHLAVGPDVHHPTAPRHGGLSRAAEGDV